MKFLVCALLVLLVGCSNSSAGGGETFHSIKIPEGMGYVTIYSVQMQDGTKCIAFSGSAKAGLSCKWQ